MSAGIGWGAGMLGTGIDVGKKVQIVCYVYVSMLQSDPRLPPEVTRQEIL
jgi:hypothetical protein